MGMEDNDKPDKLPRVRISDAETARRMRVQQLPSFMKLAGLLHNDLKALHAMREETKFIETHPGLPRGDVFAAKVRGLAGGQQAGLVSGQSEEGGRCGACRRCRPYCITA